MVVVTGVIVITGVMAAGKSTVAQLLAERLPRAAHVRGSTFEKMVVSGRRPVTPDLSADALDQLRLRYRLSTMVADEYASGGITAIVQDVILGDLLREYVDLIRTRPRYLVVLAPDRATVAERERARAKTGYGTWTVEALDLGLRHETPRLGRWLDTSRQTPAQTVNAILADLPAALIPDHRPPTAH